MRSSCVSQCLRASAVFAFLLDAMVSCTQSWLQVSAGTGIPGSAVQSLAVGDLNGDGLGDVAAIVDGKIVLLAGDGKGWIESVFKARRLPRFRLCTGCSGLHRLRANRSACNWSDF